MARGDALRNTIIVGAFTLLSRCLGLMREMLQSRLIGAGMEQSAFTLAFAIPNMFRKLFGEGALTASFVPVFRGEVERVGLDKAALFARSVMTTVMVVLGTIVALSLAGVLGAQALSGYWLFSERTRLTLSLVAILLPYMFAICAAAFAMGVLNTLGKFKASSFMPTLLNIVWIAALTVLAIGPEWSVATRIRIVAAAIMFGGFVQMGYMFRCMARVGVVPRLRFEGWRSEQVRTVWCNLTIAAMGAGAIQVNYMLDQVLAQVASPWAAGVIGYAERLMDLPLGVIGVAFGTVLLPTFAGHFAKRDLAGAREVLADSVKNLMFLMIPAAVGLFILSHEITRVIYEGGGFDATATVRVSRALAVYAVGLGFFGIQKVMIPWFQAQGDMKTPLRVSVATVGCNALLNVLAVFLLPVEWRHVGLAWSTVFCAAVGGAMLIVMAKRLNGSTGLADCVGYIARTLLASLAMAFAVIAARYSLKGFSEHYILALVVMIGAGGFVYLFAARLLGVLRLGALRRGRGKRNG